MDTQGPNPWSFQQLQVQLPKDPYSTDDTNDNTDSKNNNDHSFDSAATTPHTDYVTHTHPKNIFYGPTYEDVAHGYSVEGHVRTWSYQDTLTSDHGDDEGEDEEEPATMTSSIFTTDDQMLSSKEIVSEDAPLEVRKRYGSTFSSLLLIINAFNAHTDNKQQPFLVWSAK